MKCLGIFRERRKHVDGDLIRFYGVGPGRWFIWFYHDPSAARELPFKIEDLAFQAAAAHIARYLLSLSRAARREGVKV